MKITKSFALLAFLPGFLIAAAPAARVSGLPFFFLENRGLTDPSAHYLLKRPDLSAYFMESEIRLEVKGHTVSMLFVNGNRHARIEGVDPLEGAAANFFLGGDSSKWVTDLPIDRAVAYRALWPGIDMVYAGTGRSLKSEFRVQAGADPGLIRWTYGRPFRAGLSKDGSLSVAGESLDLSEDAPVLYQEKNGEKVAVAGAFQVFEDGSVGFHVGDYDRALPLVIDPTLTFSTFIGGNGQDEGTAVALDSNGNAYLAGWTNSNNFAQTGPAKLRGYAGSTDAFVAKFSALGDRLIYCTYLGGSGDDRALAIAVDNTGAAFIAGYTTSTNFPVSSFSPIQAKLAGRRNAFVAKLSPAGDSLAYSTYLGGEGTDTANGIGIDLSGHAFITGDTTSLKFPVTATAFQKVNNGGQDAFVAEINLNGTTMLWGTYLGGSSDDHAAGIAVNSGGNVYLTGSTYSMDFPTASPVQPVSGGNQDAFITGIAAGGRSLLFSTYMGGSGGTVGMSEEGTAIALEGGGYIMVAGATSSLNFPVNSAGVQRTYGGGSSDGFLVTLDPTGKSQVYGTYIGGSSSDRATGIALDSLGYVFVAGYTASQDFPNVRAIQAANHGLYDGFLLKFDPYGNANPYGTYIGGTGNDSITGIAVDRFGSAVLSGYTSSSDFPLAGALGQAQRYKYGTITASLSKVTTGWIPIVADQGSGTLNFSIDQAHDLGTDGTSSTLRTFGFGQPGDIPLFGDWNGSGTAKVGIYRNGVWMLDYNGNGVWDGVSGGDRQFTFGSGGTPVVGDWNGSGTIKAGWFANGAWTLDLSGLIQGMNNGLGTKLATFGQAGDIPVVGDWSGTGVTKIGVVRSALWMLDFNGNFVLDANDRTFPFGAASDLPVVGDWDGYGKSRAGIYSHGTWTLGYELWGGYNSSVGKTLTFTFGSASSIPLIGK